jgi:hypothetical protein
MTVEEDGMQRRWHGWRVDWNTMAVLSAGEQEYTGLGSPVDTVNTLACTYSMRNLLPSVSQAEAYSVPIQ